METKNQFPFACTLTKYCTRHPKNESCANEVSHRISDKVLISLFRSSRRLRFLSSRLCLCFKSASYWHTRSFKQGLIVGPMQAPNGGGGLRGTGRERERERMGESGGFYSCSLDSGGKQNGIKLQRRAKKRA